MARTHRSMDLPDDSRDSVDSRRLVVSASCAKSTQSGQNGLRTSEVASTVTGQPDMGRGIIPSDRIHFELTKNDSEFG